MAAIVFGSDEAREVLLADRRRRFGGDLHLRAGRYVDGTDLRLPARYVPALWEDFGNLPHTEGAQGRRGAAGDSQNWHPEIDEVDEPGELSGGTIVRSGWNERS